MCKLIMYASESFMCEQLRGLKLRKSFSYKISNFKILSKIVIEVLAIHEDFSLQLYIFQETWILLIYFVFI